MTSAIALSLGLAFCATYGNARPEKPARVQRPAPGWKQKAKPRIDVVFALDTTGSMASLIAGAKRKIWSLANEIASGQPRPVVRFGLVGYRDLGDSYVTRATALTTDMDALFAELEAFWAEGGGDTPEHVNKALFDAIHKMSWSRGQNVLKMIFLVGDAPPHEEYDDGLTSPALARAARAKGIVINTIVAGNAQDTRRSWQRIASLAGGEFFAIEQTGNMMAVSTPFDAQLGKLNAELAETAVGWGDQATRASLERKKQARVAMKPEVAASAASFAAKAPGSGLGSGDLLADLEAGRVKIDEVPARQLPPEMRAMSAAERRQFVEKKRARRLSVQKQIAELGKKRDAWLKQKQKESNETSLDSEVMSAVKSQARRRIHVAY